MHQNVQHQVGRATVAAVLLTQFLVARVSGQATQASRGVGQAMQSRTIDSAVAALQAAAKGRTNFVALMPSPEALAAADRASAAAERALAVRDDPDRFRDRLAEYTAAKHSLVTILDAELSARNQSDEAATHIRGLRASLADTPMPAISTLVPAVTFTVGVGRAIQTKAPTGVGINTSLLGAAAGTAFDALGSSALKEYFTNNISGGVGIPVSGAGKVSNSIGLGLGSVSFRARGELWAFWPVMVLEQLDTADANVPGSVKATKPTQASWSQPSIAIGIPILGLERTMKLVQCGKLAPIVSIGVRLPYYFPGDSYTALAAAFTNRHTEFQRGSKSVVTLSVDIPLLKVGTTPEPGTCT